ncbi:PREDICTED: F-box protein At4g02760-like [Camelina sativa]|uniref:F-box protein At4g02760-like n=1 Tax=Camelina sativa TaxID=90675 RepID=A0ABM0V677_CAMSA|nr:PREDICTED: F-box protein At4g02760-like [Camelina sativa]
MEPSQNPSKRLCRIQNPNPNSLPNVAGYEQSHVDLMISSFLSLPDLPSLSSPLSISSSFDRAVEKLFEASGDDSVQDLLTDRALQLASLLQDSTNRFSRKRASLHNSNSWSLSHDLTVKVFSMVDTKSLMQVSACCTMFKKCAMDSCCYSHIDLTTVNVRSSVVCSMILKAGKELRSLKVGCLEIFATPLLSKSCLAALSYNDGFLGNLVESLHIYNRNWLDEESLCGALSVCSNLTDLKIVRLVQSLDSVLRRLTRNCQHLFLEKELGYVKPYRIRGLSFERNCPNMTSLSLIGFDLSDRNAYHLIKGLRKLKYLNLSRTKRIKGRFFRDVSHDCKDSLLETLILQDCDSLEERDVCLFLNSLLIGNFRFIRHIDVSNTYGLIYGDRRCSKPVLPLEKLNEERPGFTFVAEFRTPASSSSSSSTSTSSSASSSSSSGNSSSCSGTDDDED